MIKILFCVISLLVTCVLSSPLPDALAEWQQQYQQQLELLSWTAQQQQLYASGNYPGNNDDETGEDTSVACECLGEVDQLGYGECDSPSPSGTMSWCYVHENSNCSDIFSYNDKTVSREACESQQVIDDNLLVDSDEESSGSGDIVDEITTESVEEITIDATEVDGVEEATTDESVKDIEDNIPEETIIDVSVDEVEGSSSDEDIVITTDADDAEDNTTEEIIEETTTAEEDVADTTTTEAVDTSVEMAEETTTTETVAPPPSAGTRCVCSGEEDKLGYGTCSAPVVNGMHWCYITDHQCEDAQVYNNMFISSKACENE